jgi:hypothetical protein
MIVRGNFNVDVAFVDSTSTNGLRVDRRITLQSTDDYDSGKVAVVSGEVGSTPVVVSFASPGYVNSAGNPVTFSNVSRLAFAAGSTTLVSCDAGGPIVYSRGSQAAVTEVPISSTFVTISMTAGSSSWTLVLYGS